ncbi:MAG: hypothetical protein JWR01_2923 [Subtercola sp.]|nr:hypothetical protein [Subtercola sp.]
MVPGQRKQARGLRTKNKVLITCYTFHGKPNVVGDLSWGPALQLTVCGQLAVVLVNVV